MYAASLLSGLGLWSLAFDLNPCIATRESVCAREAGIETAEHIALTSKTRTMCRAKLRGPRRWTGEVPLFAGGLEHKVASPSESAPHAFAFHILKSATSSALTLCYWIRINLRDKALDCDCRCWSAGYINRTRKINRTFCKNCRGLTPGDVRLGQGAG